MRGGDEAATSVESRPSWRRTSRGENRLPVTLAVLTAVALQLLLPDKLALKPHYLLPALELALLASLTSLNPVYLDRRHPLARHASIGLTGLITLANVISAALLIEEILNGKVGGDAKGLLGSGAAIYLTNVIAFALWYWEIDQGGPFERAAGGHEAPDFLFPQMATEELAETDWKPTFTDYLYVSYTNVVAFSPTDTMPLTRTAKLLMLAQSAVAVCVVALVVARAVNVLH